MTDHATDPPSTDPADDLAESVNSQAGEHPPGGALLRGTPVSSGLVLGPCHRKDYDLDRMKLQRVPLDEVERELNRFHSALQASHEQLEELKQRLAGRVPTDHARILDVHVSYLRDSVFLADVENLILNEQMCLEAAIAKVIADFDRIFRLVESETLRERAVDLRDVGIRVLRNLEEATANEAEYIAPPTDYILVARELSIVDMFNLASEHVLGIVTEEGGLTSHAAILARSMKIPTVTGVDALLDSVQEGDFLIVDSTEGVVRVNPDEVVRAQYQQERERVAEIGAGDGAPDWAKAPHATGDGTRLRLHASCGNLTQVHDAVDLGLRAIGLYRTELLYMLDRSAPTLESLVKHYRAVIEGADGMQVTFRLLDVDSSIEIGYFHEQREHNPALGRSGVRLLLEHEQVLREQLKALLLASTDADVRLAIPRINDCGELRRVKEILYEERFALRRDDAPRLSVGVIIETPVAAMGIESLMEESEFALLGLDSLLQYMLAADRENLDLDTYFEPLHPVVLRLLANLASACEQAQKPLSIFGSTMLREANLPMLVGAGLREFCVSPVELEPMLEQLQGVELPSLRAAFEQASKASCQAETLPQLENLRRDS